MRNARRTALAITACLILAASALAATPKKVTGWPLGPKMNKIKAGELICDLPTLENLGFRWYIEGDSNRNASVAVSYRKKGEKKWRKALPMLRVQNEIVDQARDNYRCGNLFAGSVLFLKPGTHYDVRFTMTDPDGGAPKPKTITALTRSVPRLPTDGQTYQVYPANHVGAIPRDAVRGLAKAFRRAKGSDVLQLQPLCYTGPFVFERWGKPDKRVIIRGADKGETIIRGTDMKATIIDVSKANRVWLENLTICRGYTGIFAGKKGGPGPVGLIVRNCTIKNVIIGINSSSEQSEDWHITDNTITGTNKNWYPRPAKDYMKPSHTGIILYGRAHVVAYNRISHFGDSIAIANYKAPPKPLHLKCVNIDIYNNDLSFAQDDTIEADYGCHNIRVYRNRCHSAHTAFSSQPSYGGPIYFIRNEAFCFVLAYKLHNYCTGIIAYHNTTAGYACGFQSSSGWQNGHFRNNLILGGGPYKPYHKNEIRKPYAIITGTLTPYSTLDYNGWRRNSPDPDRFCKWRINRKPITAATLAEFTKKTGHEKHGIMIDYDIFRKAAPSKGGDTFTGKEYDLRLKPKSKAIDKGIPLPGINDDFQGKAPDLGCYELGQEVPHYGPRKKRQ
jgi:hypothetical protein